LTFSKFNKKVDNLNSFNEHKKASKEGGKIARIARVELEKKTKRKVTSNENYLNDIEKHKRLE